MSCCQGKPANADKGPVEVFVAKRIYTMDPGWPTGDAVAVRNGRIVSVGTLESLKPWLSRIPHTINERFRGKVLLPGFIDPHMHPLIGGIASSLPCVAYYDQPNPYGPAHKGLKTKEAVLERIAQYAKETKDDTVTCWGYDSIALGGHLCKKDLDKVSSTLPIAIWDASMHYVYANTPMIKKAGITSDHCKKVGCDSALLDTDGEPLGTFLGTHAMGLVMPCITPMYTPVFLMSAMKRVIDLSVQNGITTVSELGLGLMNFKTEVQLFPTVFSRAPVRCVAVVLAEALVNQTKGDTQQALGLMEELKKGSTERFMINGVKFFTDDAFVGLTMQVGCCPGYIDGHKGIWLTEPGPAYVQRVLPWWKAGHQIHVHSNGDAGQDATLEVLEELQKAHPRFDHRFTFEHYGMSSQAHARKLQRLGACASVNGFYPHLRGELNEPHLGTDRAHLASRLKSLLNLNVPAALHTDTPIAPPSPLTEIWIAVNRFGQSGKVLAENERISVYEAVRMKTIDAAFVLGKDHLIGSIEAGKFADFTVLEEDIFEVDPARIRDVKVVATVMGGNVIEPVKPKGTDSKL